jgi:hypothetical protein
MKELLATYLVLPTRGENYAQTVGRFWAGLQEVSRGKEVKAEERKK